MRCITINNSNFKCFTVSFLYKLFQPFMRRHKILRVWEKHLKILELLLLSLQLTSITVLKVSLWMDSRKFETIRWDIYVTIPFFFYFFVVMLQWLNVINESSTFFGFWGFKRNILSFMMLETHQMLRKSSFFNWTSYVIWQKVKRFDNLHRSRSIVISRWFTLTFFTFLFIS